MGKLLEELIGLGIVSAILYETKSTEKGRKSKPLLSWDDDYDKDQIANYADAEKERIVCGVSLLNDRVSKGRSPKSVSLQCRCCNARMEISNHTQALFCPHCGTGNLIIEDSSVKNAGGKDIAYRAAESGKRKANAGIAAERKKKSGNSNPDAVVVLQEFVLAIVILAVLVVLVFPTLMRETDSDRSTHTDEIQIP